MKRLLNPLRLLFYIVSILLCFFVGQFFALLSEARVSQAVAGEGVVLFYGIIAAFPAFFAAIYIAYYLQPSQLLLMNKTLGCLLAIVVFLVIYRSTHFADLTNIPNEAPKNSIETKEIELSRVSIFHAEKRKINAFKKEEFLGLGFFKPNFYEYPTLYFYGNVNLEKGIPEHLPMDSVVFMNNELNEFTTSYAPPWLYPEHLKLDYGIIYFKVIGTGFDFLKVEANKSTGQVTYLDKNKGTFISWPEFLMLNNSLVFNEKSEGSVYDKPLEDAGQIPSQFEFIKPLLIQNEWMYAKLVDKNLVENGKGWIRWKKGKELLVSYVLPY
jgi:hypothetical protein